MTERVNDITYGAMKLLASDTQLFGKWLFENGMMRADQVCERIDWLTTNHLQKLRVIGWLDSTI